MPTDPALQAGVHPDSDQEIIPLIDKIEATLATPSGGAMVDIFFLLGALVGLAKHGKLAETTRNRIDEVFGSIRGHADDLDKRDRTLALVADLESFLSTTRAEVATALANPEQAAQDEAEGELPAEVSSPEGVDPSAIETGVDPDLLAALAAESPDSAASSSAVVARGPDAPPAAASSGPALSATDSEPDYSHYHDRVEALMALGSPDLDEAAHLVLRLATMTVAYPEENQRRIARTIQRTAQAALDRIDLHKLEGEIAELSATEAEARLAPVQADLEAVLSNSQTRLRNFGATETTPLPDIFEALLAWTPVAAQATAASEPSEPEAAPPAPLDPVAIFREAGAFIPSVAVPYIAIVDLFAEPDAAVAKPLALLQRALLTALRNIKPADLEAIHSGNITVIDRIGQQLAPLLTRAQESLARQQILEQLPEPITRAYHDALEPFQPKPEPEPEPAPEVETLNPEMVLREEGAFYIPEVVVPLRFILDLPYPSRSHEATKQVALVQEALYRSMARLSQTDLQALVTVDPAAAKRISDALMPVIERARQTLEPYGIDVPRHTVPVPEVVAPDPDDVLAALQKSIEMPEVTIPLAALLALDATDADAETVGRLSLIHEALRSALTRLDPADLRAMAAGDAAAVQRISAALAPRIKQAQEALRRDKILDDLPRRDAVYAYEAALDRLKPDVPMADFDERLGVIMMAAPNFFPTIGEGVLAIRDLHVYLPWDHPDPELANTLANIYTILSDAIEALDAADLLKLSKGKTAERQAAARVIEDELRPALAMARTMMQQQNILGQLPPDMLEAYRRRLAAVGEIVRTNEEIRQHDHLLEIFNRLPPSGKARQAGLLIIDGIDPKDPVVVGTLDPENLATLARINSVDDLIYDWLNEPEAQTCNDDAERAERFVAYLETSGQFLFDSLSQAKPELFADTEYAAEAALNTQRQAAEGALITQAQTFLELTAPRHSEPLYSLNRLIDQIGRAVANGDIDAGLFAPGTLMHVLLFNQAQTNPPTLLHALAEIWARHYPSAADITSPLHERIYAMLNQLGRECAERLGATHGYLFPSTPWRDVAALPAPRVPLGLGDGAPAAATPTPAADASGGGPAAPAVIEDLDPLSSDPDIREILARYVHMPSRPTPTPGRTRAGILAADATARRPFEITGGTFPQPQVIESVQSGSFVVVGYHAFVEFRQIEPDSTIILLPNSCAFLANTRQCRILVIDAALAPTEELVRNGNRIEDLSMADFQSGQRPTEARAANPLPPYGGTGGPPTRVFDSTGTGAALDPEPDWAERQPVVPSRRGSPTPPPPPRRPSPSPRVVLSVPLPRPAAPPPAPPPPSSPAIAAPAAPETDQTILQQRVLDYLHLNGPSSLVALSIYLAIERRATRLLLEDLERVGSVRFNKDIARWERVSDAVITDPLQSKILDVLRVIPSSTNHLIGSVSGRIEDIERAIAALRDNGRIRLNTVTNKWEIAPGRR